MIETIQTINYLLALDGLVGIAFTLFLIYDLKTKRYAAKFVKEWGLWIALIMTIFATVLTLVYSEFFGIIPCGLCWLERLALYPQILIIAVGIYFKDTLMPRYGIILSIFGLIISLYHHYIQMGGSQFIKCPAVGAGADCAKRFFFEFGFITFPLMSAILFTFLIVLYFYLLKVRND